MFQFFADAVDFNEFTWLSMVKSLSNMNEKMKENLKYVACGYMKG